LRSEEVERLETWIGDLQADMQDVQESVDYVQIRLEHLQERENTINLNVR
jgi:hypothetical protein